MGKKRGLVFVRYENAFQNTKMELIFVRTKVKYKSAMLHRDGVQAQASLYSTTQAAQL